MVVCKEERLNVSRRDVVYDWNRNTADSRQHYANMPRHLVKVLEGTSWTKTQATHGKHQRSAEDATADIDPKAEWSINDDKKELIILKDLSHCCNTQIFHTQQCLWTHRHTRLRICAWTEEDGMNCDDATDKCRHRRRPMDPATSRWATPRSFAQSLAPPNRDAQEVLEMPKQRSRSRLAWPVSAASSARDVQRVTSELASHLHDYSAEN
jgi:hypothetical protein